MKSLERYLDWNSEERGQQMTTAIPQQPLPRAAAFGRWTDEKQNYRSTY